MNGGARQTEPETTFRTTWPRNPLTEPPSVPLPHSSSVASTSSYLQHTHIVGLAPLRRGSSTSDRLAGLVVKASASRAEDPGFQSRLRRDFFGVESYQ